MGTLDDLRKPFPATAIGKKPQVICKACTDATRNARSAADKHCGNHLVKKCAECKVYITTGHTHLDYVGHAVATGRLLDVDPEWTWEPMGLTPDGLPATDQAGNLWIWLTVLGVRRPGVGDGSSAKEAIGDAIRNAAMRFGVALDLWAKEELEHAESEEAKPEPVKDEAALKRELWAASLERDADLSDEERQSWLRGEVAAAGSIEAVLREWAK